MLEIGESESGEANSVIRLRKYWDAPVAQLDRASAFEAGLLKNEVLALVSHTDILKISPEQ
jgi:hypothetical protein